MFILKKFANKFEIKNISIFMTFALSMFFLSISGCAYKANMSNPAGLTVTSTPSGATVVLVKTFKGWPDPDGKKVWKTTPCVYHSEDFTFRTEQFYTENMKAWMIMAWKDQPEGSPDATMQLGGGNVIPESIHLDLK